METERIYQRILERMGRMVTAAVTTDGEERAFTETENAEFCALEAAAKALRPIAKKAPDTVKIREAFTKR